MTTLGINLRREVLVEDLRRKLGGVGHDFPYDRIHAGDWKVAIDELLALISEACGDKLGRLAGCGRGFVRLAQHARDCPDEASLILPLLQGMTASDTGWLSTSLQVASEPPGWRWHAASVVSP